jgi:hypothetical protein
MALTSSDVHYFACAAAGSNPPSKRILFKAKLPLT